jgi:Pentapeptide repeats (8 copies)
MDITQLKVQYKAGERNFSGAKLSGVNLVWVELTGVNFQGADLSHANLSGANLSESNFSGETNLTFADLSRTDFRNTNLKGTRLEGANLEGIQLEGAVYDETTRFPLGFDPMRAGAIASGALQPQPVTPAQAKSDVDLEQYTTQEHPKPWEKETKPKSLSSKPSGSKPTIENAVDTAKELFQKVRSATVDAVSDWQEPKQLNWFFAKSPRIISIQDELNTSGQGKSGIVPASIKGRWNWGALLLPWLWFLPNRVWGGFWLWLLMWVPGWGRWITIGFAIAMAANGNTWAWQSRKWDSIKAFKNHQRTWAIAGMIVWSLIFIISSISPK